MQYLDANVFLFAALDNGPRGQEAAKLLAGGRSEDVVTSTLTVDEVVWAVWKRFDRDRAVAQGERMLAARNITYRAVTADHVAAALRIMDDHGLQPRDAIHVAVALDAGASKIVSEDPDFDKVPGLERVGMGA